MSASDIVERLQTIYADLAPVLDERSRRQWAAAEARAYGRGGLRAVCLATGLSHNTVRRGQRELAERAAHPDAPVSTRIRQPGGGRQRLTAHDPALQDALDQLIDPLTRGDPTSALRWTCKSTGQLAQALSAAGHPVSASTVWRLLRADGYSLQSNRKTREGAQHPDRDAQFRHIAAQVRDFQQRGQPVISVDTKKKELIGDFRNAGREWHPRGQPTEVRIHDFIDPALGKAIPYGVYDLSANEGWVSVGIDHDTAQFAAAAIERWWRKMGVKRYPRAHELLITADGGGSNGNRSRLWKVALQALADRLGLLIHVCHFPPGTSKWNTIEHRMFSHITQNWRGRPLVSHEVVINLIAATTTQHGLQIQAGLDKGRYPTGLKVSDAELDEVQLSSDDFHGDWNYRIAPARKHK